MITDAEKSFMTALQSALVEAQDVPGHEVVGAINLGLKRFEGRTLNAANSSPEARELLRKIKSAVDDAVAADIPMLSVIGHMELVQFETMGMVMMRMQAQARQAAQSGRANGHEH